MRQLITRDDVIDRMHRRQNGRTALALAQELGISPQYLCDVFLGRREPGDKMLSAMGLKRRVMYEVQR